MLQTRVSVSEDMVLKKCTGATYIQTEIEQRKQRTAVLMHENRRSNKKAIYYKRHPKEHGTSDSWYYRQMFPNYVQKCSPVFYSKRNVSIVEFALAESFPLIRY